MQAFGTIVAPRTPAVLDPSNAEIHIATAALSATDAVRDNAVVTLSFTTSVTKKKIALCTLRSGKVEQAQLNITFSANDGEIQLFADGNAAVHLAGVAEIDEFDEAEDDGVDDADSSKSGDESDDEEAPELVPVAPAPAPAPAPAKGKAAKAAAAAAVAAAETKAAETKTPAKGGKAAKAAAEAPAADDADTRTPAPKRKRGDEAAAAAATPAAAAAPAPAPAPKTPAEKPKTPGAEKPKTPGVEWVNMKNGLKFIDTVKGLGAKPTPGKNVKVKYIGKLENGRVFDSGDISFRFGVGQVIQGWDLGIESMRVGGARTLVIPSKLGYGSEGSPPVIPPNATLIFSVELVRA